MATYQSVPSHSAGDTLSAATDWTPVANNLNTFVGTQIGCRVYNSGNVSTTGSLAAITFDSERYDTDSMHSTSSNTSRITFVTPGIYTITGNVEWQLDPDSNVPPQTTSGGGTTVISQPSNAYTQGQAIGTVVHLYSVTIDVSRAELAIKINGTTLVGLNSVNLRGNTTTRQTVTTVYQAAANDYAELWASSSASITINNTAQYSPEFMAVRA